MLFDALEFARDRVLQRNHAAAKLRGFLRIRSPLLRSLGLLQPPGQRAEENAALIEGRMPRPRTGFRGGSGRGQTVMETPSAGLFRQREEHVETRTRLGQFEL